MKYPFIFLLLLFLHTQINGQQQNEIQLSSFNDSWGGGSTPVYDDLRSYGFQLGYYLENNVRIDSRYSHLTNRFDADTSQRKSFDEFSIIGSIPITKTKKDSNILILLKPGVLFRGPLLGTPIQNATHTIFGVAQTDLPNYNEKGTHLTMGYLVLKTILNKRLTGGRSFQVQLEHSIDYTHNYMSMLRLGVPIVLKTNRSQIILQGDFILAKNYLDNNDLLRKVLDAESGLCLNLKIVGKSVFYYFKTFPNTGFSYGGIGVRIRKKEENFTPTNLNLEIATSVLSNGYGYNCKYSFLPSTALNRKIKMILNHNYHTYLKRFLPDTLQINGHGNQLTIGAEIYLLKSKDKTRIIEPYTNLSFGDKSICIYSKTRKVDKVLSHHLAINNDLGLNAQIPFSFNGSATNLNLSFYHRLTMMTSLTPKDELEFREITNSPYANIQDAFGIGVRFKI